MRISIADDSAVSLNFLKTVLASWAYEVLTCADGSQAWEELRKEDAPKLAILDWSMPGLDGLDIVRHIRKANLDRYVLMLTAKDTFSDIVEGRDAGADDYIFKPFKREEMELRIRSGERFLRLREQLESLGHKPMA